MNKIIEACLFVLLMVAVVNVYGYGFENCHHSGIYGCFGNADGYNNNNGGYGGGGYGGGYGVDFGNGGYGGGGLGGVYGQRFGGGYGGRGFGFGRGY
jgi:hypothetical protein